MSATVYNLAYLLAAVLFIVGLKGLTHPRSAVRGNALGGLAMLIAVVVTLLAQDILNPGMVIAGIAVGAAIGAVLAVTIKMTAMPQLVGLYNGFGGIASVLVAGAVLYQALNSGLGGTGAAQLQFLVATAASGLIGGVTFFGSLIAFGKLQGID
ncbi:MAG: NAD(P)(+) transhydrogenase (Re/Si-specific) subunit beta, partial [Spirochaeta sp.]|nr:NAD(P)(+) transhydrogenase (Re/Si-specific) subunit beta [Spirochaeta sp.]